MDDTLTLFGLSFAMLVGCYLAGSIPLAFNFSEEKLKLVSVMGAGLLVGTALSVIIPEGVHTLYDGAAQVAARAHAEAHEAVKAAVDQADEHSHGHSHEHGHSHQGPELHSIIGMSLVIGFIVMLLIDQLSGGHSHSHGPPADAEAGAAIQHKVNMTATIGLVVHAAADGVALGAAASTSQRHVEMIVFVAIMLHKAPAAFGLVSFLLHEGFERNRIRRHLAIFSAAAPLLAVITYFSLSQQSKETLSEINATGIAMLFSGGTFLYVATVHILPEVASMGTTKSAMADGTIVIRENKGFNKLELCLMVFGAILPLFLSLGHHH